MQILQDKDFYIQKRSEYKQKGLVYYSKSEEIVNAASHFLAGILGLVIMAYTLFRLKTAPLIVAAVLSGIFCAFPYFVSGVYHSVSNEKAKAAARKIDHAGICFIILACGVPLTLGMKIHVFDIVALSVCIGIAFLNITLSVINLKRFSRVMMLLDLLTALIFTASYFVNRVYIPVQSKWFFISGALFCLAGFSFFGRKTQYMHSAFHILMLAGTTACLHAGMFVLLM